MTQNVTQNQPKQTPAPPAPPEATKVPEAAKKEQEQAAPPEPLVIETAIVKQTLITDARPVQMHKDEKPYLLTAGKRGAYDKDGNFIYVKAGARVWVKPESAASMMDLLEPLEE